MSIQSDHLLEDGFKESIGNIIQKHEKYQQPIGEWLVPNGFLSQKDVGRFIKKQSRNLNGKKSGEIQDFRINFKSEYGHLKYNLICPLCREDILSFCGTYPESITCPYCKTQFEFNKL